MKILFTNQSLLEKSQFVEKASMDCDKIFIVPTNPRIEFLDDILVKLRENQSSNEDFEFVCIGGGSVIDSCKIIADLLNRGQKLNDEYLKNKKRELVRNIELNIYPTTFGTGAEITGFSTLWDFNNKVKYSIGQLDYIRKKTEYIYELYLSMPKIQVVSNYLDAGSHAIESKLGKINNPEASEFSDLALRMFLEIHEKKPRHYITRKNIQQFIDLGVAAGKAINLNRTSICHAISYQLTMNFKIPHGIAAFLTIPPTLELLESKNNFKLLDVEVIDEILSEAIEISGSELAPVGLIDYDILIDSILMNERANNFNFEISKNEIKAILVKALTNFNSILKI